MGKRGPAKTPSLILEKRGSWLAKTRNNEPAHDSGKPVCPSGLNPEAKRIWKLLLPKMAPAMLQKVDGFALARYCDAYARWWKTRKFLDEHGEVYPKKRTDKHGNVFIESMAAFPQMRIYNMLEATLSRLEGQFGLTPSARASLALDHSVAKKDTGKGRFFNQSG